MSQGLSWSIALETENPGTVSHNYCLGKTPLEVLVESWPTSSINPENQLSSRDDMGCMELSSRSCAEIGVPIDFRRVSQGISVVV